jgi:hypothetical protein
LKEGEIRLLKVLTDPRQSAAGDLMKFSLTTASIEKTDIELRPVLTEYNALSYVWGDESNKKQIVVNEAIFYVTENLHAALTHLRTECQSLPIWVDAVCINQSNEKEKGNQLSQMNFVYRSAASVLVFLGSSTESTDLVIDNINNFDSHTLTEEVLADASGVAGLIDIWLRPWFERVWVLQEVTMGRKHAVTFACGFKRLSWERLYEAMLIFIPWFKDELVKGPVSAQPKVGLLSQYLKQTGRSLRSVSEQIRRADDTLRLRHRYLENKLDISLSFLLTKCLEGMKCSDERDRIYALAGISNDIDLLGPSSDYYKQCWHDLYADITRSLIKRGFVDLLGLCRNQDTRLPSWVPDWGQKNFSWVPDFRQNSLQTKRLFRASHNTSVVLRDDLLFYSRILAIEGFEVDKLLRVGTRLAGVRDAFDLAAVRSRFEETELFLSHSMKYTSHERNEASWRIPIGDLERVDFDHDTIRATNCSFEAYSDIKTYLAQSINPVKMDKKYLLYILHMTGVPNTKPFLSIEGYVGLCPSEAQPDDIIFIPLGAQMPYVVRKLPGGNHQLIGEAYVHGIMDGALIAQNPKLASNVFCLE